MGVYIGPSEAQATAVHGKRDWRDRDRPHRREHEASLRLVGSPRTLATLKAEFRDAVESENRAKLHEHGTEEDGSPRWTEAFRRFVEDTAALARDDQGYFRYPLRASIAAMASDRRSAITRQAAELLFLMRLSGDYDHVRAWRIRLGIFRDDEFVQGTADPIAFEALRRWWAFYSQDQRERTSVERESPTCTYHTPECPHGRGAPLT